MDDTPTESTVIESIVRPNVISSTILPTGESWLARLLAKIKRA